jgi:hypothetical protein
VLWEQQGLNLEQVLPGSKTPDAILALEKPRAIAYLGQIWLKYLHIEPIYVYQSSNVFFSPKYYLFILKY